MENIHGAVAGAVRNSKKPESKLDILYIADLSKTAGIPLVLYGGSGVNQQCLLDAIDAGIAKINVDAEMRQIYELAMEKSNNDILYAQEQLYLRTRECIKEYLCNTNLKDCIACF